MLNDDDDDRSNDEDDETDLESFTTVLESQEEIDEFEIFFVSLQRKSKKSFLRENMNICLR